MPRIIQKVPFAWLSVIFSKLRSSMVLFHPNLRAVILLSKVLGKGDLTEQSLGIIVDPKSAKAVGGVEAEGGLDKSG